MVSRKAATEGEHDGLVRAGFSAEMKAEVGGGGGESERSSANVSCNANDTGALDEERFRGECGDGASGPSERGDAGAEVEGREQGARGGADLDDVDGVFCAYGDEVARVGVMAGLDDVRSGRAFEPEIRH